MLDATISGSLFTRPQDGGTSIDLSSLETLTLQHEAALKAVDFESLLGNLSSVSSTELIWSNGNNTLTLSGTGITPTSTAAELEAAVQAGTANGTLDTLSLAANGAEILRVDIGSGVISIVSGAHRIDLTMNYPQNLTALLELVSIPLDLGTVLSQSESEFQDMIDALQGYGVSGISFAENGVQQIGATFGGSSVATLTLLGYTAAIQGQAPNDFVGLLAALKAIDGADGDLSASASIAINGLTVTAPDGALLLEVTGTGEITNADDLNIDSVSILGSTGDEYDINLSGYSYYYGQPVISRLSLEDVRGLTGGDGEIDVQMDAGNDWLSLSAFALIDHQKLSVGNSEVSLDGGADYDTMYVSFYAGSTYSYAQLYQQNAYYDAYNAAIQQAHDQGLYDPYNFDAYNEAYNAYWANPNRTGPEPQQEDFLNPSALLDFDLYEQDVAAKDAAFIARYGSIPIADFVLVEDYKVPYSDQDDYDQPTYATLQAYDYDALYAARNDYYSSGAIGDEPVLSDFRINEAYFDHSGYEAADQLISDYNNNYIYAGDVKYQLPTPNLPEFSDFRNDVADFDFDAFEVARLEAAADLGVSLDIFFNPISPNDDAFRTSPLPADYSQNGGIYPQAIDYQSFFDAQNIFYSSGGTGEGPNKYDFAINEDLFDHAAMEAYDEKVMNFYRTAPSQGSFYVGENLRLDLTTGILSVNQGDQAVASAEFQNFERFSLDGNGEFEVLGSDQDDAVRVHNLDPESSHPKLIEFDGAAGIDRIEFDRTYLDREKDERGLTQEAFLEKFALVNRVDGSIDVKFKDTGDLFINMVAVEQLRFALGAEHEIVDIASLFNGLVVVGTENEDTLNGSTGDDTVNALAGADYISGNGGNDSVNAGAGADIISIIDGDSTVDGGEGYDSLRVTGFSGARMDINFSFDGGLSAVEIAAFDDANGQLGSVNGSNIERVGVGFDGDLNVVGDSQDNHVKLVSAPKTFSFDGGDGFDELQLHELVLPGDQTVGRTRAEFEARIRLVEKEGTDAVDIELRSTGEVVGEIKSVESARFAADNAEGYETVAYSDLTIYQNVDTREGDDAGDLGAGNQTYTANDTGQSVAGGAGDDDLNGGAAGDNLDGGDDDDAVDGGGGDDVVNGGDGQDTVSGGEGNDTVSGGDGEDTVSGGEGDDELDGGADNDTLDGGEGFDTLLGGEGDDRLNDGVGAEIDGGEGNDVGVTVGGNNTFNDTGMTAPVDQTEINDFYCGGIGNDSMNAGLGNDILIGDANSVYYFGQDTLDGGAGVDLLQGGLNEDVFVFEANDATYDGLDGSAIIGDDVIGGFSLNDVFAALGENPSDITSPLLSPTAADFEIGVDKVSLNNFTVAEQATLEANFLADLGNDGSGSARYQTDGMSILFFGVSEAEIEAAGFNAVFDFDLI